MPSPASRVLSAPKPLRLRSIQHGQHIRRCNLSNRLLPKRRAINAQRHPPLRPVLEISPLGLLRREESLGKLSERLTPGAFARLDRINARRKQLASLGGFLTGFREPCRRAAA